MVASSVAAASSPDFFSKWHLELAMRHVAIIVTCEYPFFPEANIDEILEDINDFWKWTHTELHGLGFGNTNEKAHVDTDRILLARGYLGLHMRRKYPDQVIAVTAKVREVDLSLKFHLAIRDGEHGFDAASKIDEEWMESALKDVVAALLE